MISSIKKSQGDFLRDKSQRYKEDSFVVPKHPTVDEDKADARIQAVLDQVDQAVQRRIAIHAIMWGFWGTWNSTPAIKIYVKHLETPKQFRWRRFQKKLIFNPKINGLSEYGFIKISWAHSAPVI
jgi:hypothetical protein